MKERLLRLLSNDWVVGLFLLGVYYITNGYVLGWDDQHVEIPLLKSLIDPTLYPGDYYITALKQNFTCYLYPILARIITIDQIPAAYFFLYLISRYFLFFWMFKLWRLIAQSAWQSVVIVSGIILVFRVEEFLYRTFSHQELALAIIVAGIYYFYKDRFFLSALLLGLAANFHALYSLFPMMYVAAYLALNHRRHGWKALFLSSAGFLLASGPVLAWLAVKYSRPDLPGGEDAGIGWYELYKIACPQNFVFLDVSLVQMATSLKKFIEATDYYFFILGLLTLSALHLEEFRRDAKMRAVLLTVAAMFALTFVCTYIFPVRFILDLNLVRHAQYLLFFLCGYGVLQMYRAAQAGNIWTAAAAGLMIPFISGNDLTAAIGTWLIVFASGPPPTEWKRLTARNRTFLLIRLVGLVLCGSWALYILFTNTFNEVFFRWLKINTGIIAAAAILSVVLKNPPRLRPLYIVTPLLAILINFGIYHAYRVDLEAHGKGFWQMQREWIAMQGFIKENTPKSAVFLIPHDMEMGGFRIHSERSPIMEYRDCGVIGFSYAAGKEWYARLGDLERFKVYATEDTLPAIMSAVFEYKANYIIFVRYIPLIQENDLLELVHFNDVFALYKIKPNPLPGASNK